MEIHSIEELRHLSPSKMNMLARCPWQFLQSYILGIKRPPSSALTVGSCFDKSMESNYLQKIYSHEDLPAKEMEGVFEEEFNIREDETEWHKGEHPVEIRDLGVKCVSLFAEEVCPKVQPIGANLTKEIAFAETGIGFKGILDVLEEDRIIDNKTSSSRWGVQRPKTEFQTFAYPLLIDPLMEREVIEMRYDIAVKNKTPVTQQLVHNVTIAERQGFLNLIAKTIEEIKWRLETGNWIPRQNHWGCSKKWCGYHRECARINNLTIPD